MARTLVELAREALAVQDASNLSGVVHGMSRAMTDLFPLCSGTDERNHHPVMVLWADKVAHLAGCQAIGSDTVMTAYRKVHAILEADNQPEVTA